MAQLNVRERRVEAKIAYTGPVGAGKTTNFESLSQRRLLRDDDVIAVEWRPASTPTFRDCEVVVSLITNRSNPSEDSMRALLDEADGIVFVADANADAVERNRESMEVVRKVIGRSSKRHVPIVVQVNKTDLLTALPPREVLDAMAASSLPYVTAIAARGDGVLETAERALADVVQALRAESQNGHDASPQPARVEGNPLLTALRQVLRETVSEHVVRIEARMISELERMFTGVEERLAAKDLEDRERDAARMHEFAEALRALTLEVRMLEASLQNAPPPRAPADEESKNESRARVSAVINETNRLVRELSDEMKRRKWTLFR